MQARANWGNKIIKLGQILLLCALAAACDMKQPNDDNVLDIARTELRAQLAMPAGMQRSQKDRTLDRAVESSKFSIFEPCQIHPNIANVYVCSVKIDVNYPLQVSEDNRVIVIPVITTKNRQGVWVNVVDCQGEYSHEC